MPPAPRRPPSGASPAPRSRPRAARCSMSRRPSSTAAPSCSRRRGRARTRRLRSPPRPARLSRSPPRAPRPRARESTAATLAIDAATRTNLELTRTLGGERAGSLLAAIDCTVTPGGARLLAERLAGPLTDVDAIRRRQDAVAALVEAGDLRERLRATLRQTPHLARALPRPARRPRAPR